MTSLATVSTPALKGRDFGLFILLCVVYCACGMISVTYTKEFGRVSCLWPANAIMLAAMLRLDQPRRILVMLATLVSSLIVGVLHNMHLPDAVIVGCSLANVIEITLAAVILDHVVGERFEITSTRHIRYGLLACILAPMFSGLGSAMLLHAYRYRDLADSYVIWSFAHALGLAVFTPLFMILNRKSIASLLHADKIRRTAVILGLLFVALAVVMLQSQYPLTFIPLGVLVLAAFQLGVPGAAISLAITAVAAVIAAITNNGPMAMIDGTLTEKILITQTFIGVSLIVVLPVASAIEQRARLALDLVSQKDAAQRANQAKSEFLTSMSHELRTPLNAISGFAQLLQMDKSRDSRDREYIDYIVKSGDHLIKLVGDVLDLAKIEAGRIDIEKQVFSAGDLVTEVGAVLSPLAVKKDIALNIEVPQNTAYVDTDIGRLKQVLINFGSNAIKYNKPKGTATISMTIHDGMARIMVADTGLGIAMEQQAQMFRPFNRLGHENGPIEGTGIGLAISKSLIEAMGGTLGFESALGFGTRFWVDLPLSEAKLAAAIEEEAHPVFEKSNSRLTILYIEDNKANAHLMTSITRDFLGANLVIADLGEEGIKTARSLKPDLIISDIHLPDTNGYDLFRRLRADSATWNIPVIAVTADAMPHTVERARKAGFDDFFTKPFQVPDILRAIQTLVPPAAAA